MGAITVLIAAAGESLLVATASADATLQDTYYVVVNTQKLICVAAIFCLFAGFYALFPRITGWAFNRLLAWAHFLLTFAGTAASLSVGFALFWTSVPLRYEDYSETFLTLNRVATVSAYVAGAGTALFLFVLIEALLRRRPA